ncbi:MAG TPA: hypothetical protein VFD43_14030 [Planctomycetota bacterium]|nr:hypothetical protein [Planctomycetota bacterium]
MPSAAPDPLLASGAEPEPQGPDLRALLLGALSRSLGWFAVLTGLGALTGLAIGAAQPNEYASKAKLLLRVGAREQVSSESMVGPEGTPRISAPTMDDELQMLADVAIFERVVGILGPEPILRPADPARHDGPGTPVHVRLLHGVQRWLFAAQPSGHDCSGPFCGTCVQRATRQLQEQTTLVNEPDSNVIQVSCVSTSPQQAQRLVQVLTDAFIERHREQFSIQALVETNRPKVEQARRERDAAAIAYLDYLNRSTVEGEEPQSTTFFTELSALEDKLWEAKLELAQAKEQNKAYAERNHAPVTPVTSTGPVLRVPNEKYEVLLEQKRSLAAERNAYPAPSPVRALELDRRIAEVEDSLARQQRVVSKATQGRMLFDPGTPLPEGEITDEQALELKVQALTLRYQEKKANADEARRTNLLAEQQLKDLAARRDSAEDRYEQMQERFSMLEALGAIDLNEGANLRLLQTPTLEHEKTGPKRVRLLLQGTLAGLLAGVLVAIARQKLDPTLRDPARFEQDQRIPVLGVVPRLAALSDPPGAAAGKEG